jgi:predicted acylesterase/phospholipase RssA
MGADVVIAVDVTTDEQAIAEMGNSLARRRGFPTGLAEAVDVLGRSLLIMMAEMSRRQLVDDPPDVVIRPSLPARVSALGGFSQASQLISLGEQAAQEAMPRVREALQATTS